MAYRDNDRKLVAILNASVPLPNLLNAFGHATAGLAAGMPQTSESFLDYANLSEGFNARINLSPFIVLKAKNSGQIATARRTAAEANIPYNVFISAMVGSSAEEQLAATREAAGVDLVYWVLALYGPSELLQPITKRFSLWNLGIEANAPREPTFAAGA